MTSATTTARPPAPDTSAADAAIEEAARILVEAPVAVARSGLSLAETGQGQREAGGHEEPRGYQGRHESTLLSRQPW